MVSIMGTFVNNDSISYGTYPTVVVVAPGQVLKGTMCC